MKKTILASLLLFSVLAAFSFQSCNKAPKKTELTVLAAASLTDVCAELKTAYEKEHPGTEIFFSFGGSGALKAQIESGVPADLFISAAQKQMQELDDKNLMEKQSIKNLLKNEVVLIAPKESKLKINSFEELPQAGMIAVGEPESVPIGMYTKQICTYLGIWSAVEKKANFASDVRTVLSWVESGECDFGVVYKTDAAASGKIQVIAAAPKNSCPQVIYPVGVIGSSQNKAGAAAFEDFLFSGNAESIFTKHGFSVVKD